MGDNPNRFRPEKGKRYRIAFTDTGRFSQVEWPRQHDFSPEVQRQAEAAAAAAETEAGLFSDLGFAKTEMRIVSAQDIDALRLYFNEKYEDEEDRHKAMLAERARLKNDTFFERMGSLIGRPSLSLRTFFAIDHLLALKRKETKKDEE